LRAEIGRKRRLVSLRRIDEFSEFAKAAGGSKARQLPQPPDFERVSLTFRFLGNYTGHAFAEVFSWLDDPLPGIVGGPYRPSWQVALSTRPRRPVGVGNRA
jgi:hypothetical protein